MHSTVLTKGGDSDVVRKPTRTLAGAPAASRLLLQCVEALGFLLAVVAAFLWQLPGSHRALVGSEQPSLQQRGDSVAGGLRNAGQRERRFQTLTARPYYLDEFTFRFNRRRSKSRGKLFFRLMQQAVNTPPATYEAMIKVSPQPQAIGAC